MQIIDGKELSKQVKQQVKQEVDNYISKGNRKPRLDVILVGDNSASQIYVRNKEKSAKMCNIDSYTHVLPESSTKEDVEDLIIELNNNTEVDGILLQLPLPDKLKQYEEYFIELISYKKDVDGFHPINIGKLSLGLPCSTPCTPTGVITMLESLPAKLEGKHAVIIGRSNIVGKPLIQMLLNKNCTVTTCHSRTTNIEEITKQADILVVAIGKPEFVTKDMVKDGAIVIDVGINRKEGSKKICGDVDFENVKDKVSYITPVPGGVGPMTIASLMKNTLECYKRNI